MQGKVRVGRCGESKVCWGPIPQYISLHLPHYPPHILSPHSYTLSHSPHTLSHTLPTYLSLPPPTPQHISLHLPPHTPYFFSQLPWPPPTPQHTSLFTPCILPTSYPTFWICGEVTMWQCYLNEVNSKSPIKFLQQPGIYSLVSV